jgi:hypothetical protein
MGGYREEPTRNFSDKTTVTTPLHYQGSSKARLPYCPYRKLDLGEKG